MCECNNDVASRLTWLVLDTQVKVCSRKTHSPSRASKIYGHQAFQITHTHRCYQQWSRKTLATAHTVGLRWGASLSTFCGYNPG